MSSNWWKTFDGIFPDIFASSNLSTNKRKWYIFRRRFTPFHRKVFLLLCATFPLTFYTLHYISMWLLLYSLLCFVNSNVLHFIPETHSHVRPIIAHLHNIHSLNIRFPLQGHERNTKHLSDVEFPQFGGCCGRSRRRIIIILWSTHEPTRHTTTDWHATKIIIPQGLRYYPAFMETKRVPSSSQENPQKHAKHFKRTPAGFKKINALLVTWSQYFFLQNSNKTNVYPGIHEEEEEE